MLDQNTLSAQNLLYSRPLYRYTEKNEARINVLVLGWNDFSQKFVDQCLQAGQMDSHFLKLTVLSADAETSRRAYLEQRPALDQFVDVNDSLKGTGAEAYAALDFVGFEVCAGDPAAVDRITELFAKAPGGKYHYCVISMDSGEENRRIAEALKNAADAASMSDLCAIHYVDQAPACDPAPCGIWPIRTDGQAGVEENSELERMAYNAHMVWDDAINGDALAELESFRADEYSYLSSVALALSVKYKLATLGIYSEDVASAAEAFWNALQRDENQEVINRVIALEHRRWVLDLVCQGWTAPKPEDRLKYYDECVEKRRVKDKENRIHPCLVRSTAAAPLSAGPYAAGRDAWDVPDEERDAGLDELDRMSIELHRRMQRQADAYRKSNPLEQGVIAKLRSWVRENGDERIAREWERFLFCVKNILDGNWAYSKQYDQYKERFAASLGQESEQQRFVEAQLENLSAQLWPVLEANMYRDYKKYDEVLVKRIPFILTYQIHLSMAMAFRTSPSLSTMNDHVFQNVASATVIKPEKITYLLFLEAGARREIIRQMIQMVRKYMSGKGIHCQLDFLVMGQKREYGKTYRKWAKCFDCLRETGCISGYQFQLVDSDQEAVDYCSAELRRRKIDLFDGTTNPFQSMYANSELMQRIGEWCPYFEFDSRNKQFRRNYGCRFLSYIEDRTYLGIEEMFGLLGAEDMEYHYPVLGDEYRNLWNIYTGRGRGNKNRWKENLRYSVKCWNVMCDTLENYAELHPDQELVNLGELQRSYRGYQRWSDILSIIRELAGEYGGKQYLIPEKGNGQMTAFRYASDDLKSVLTKAGDILEIYTYFRVCEKGYFDDVACGYRFRWEKEKVNNELDLVLTKGFQSLIVECKARSRLDQNFYFKLNSLVDMFGVGAHKVLLTTANTENNNDNRMQRERGNMMGITTISEIDEIQEIADVLMALLQQ